MRRSIGMTLTEILVALFIFTGFTGGVYYMLKEVNHKRAMGEARSQAMKEAGMILSTMQQDFAAAKLGSFKNLDEVKPAFKVGVGKVGQEVGVGYEFQKPYLTRKFGAWIWTVGKHIEDLKISKDVATGQVLIEVTTSVTLDGLRQDQAQKHTQSMMVVMRADNSSMNDPHWRDVGEATGLIDVKGSIMQGLGQDAEDFFGNAADELGAAVGDPAGVGMAAGMGVEGVKAKLADQYQKILSQLSSLDTRIAGTDPRGIMKYPEGWEKITYAGHDMGGCGNAMKNCLSNMKTKSSMNIDTIKGIARSYGYSNRVRDTIQSLYDAKKSLFEAGSQLLENITKFEKQYNVDVDTPESSIFS